MIMNINEVDVKKWNSSFHTKFTGSGKLDLNPKSLPLDHLYVYKFIQIC